MKKDNLPKDLRKQTTTGVLKFLKKKNCTIKGGGKHVKVTHPEHRGAIIVANGRKELPIGTFRAILKAIRNWGLLVIALYAVYLIM